MKSICVFSLTISCILLSSCATVFNSTQVTLYDCPNNIKVSENGQPIEVKQVVFGASQQSTFYTSGMHLKRSKEDHVITLDNGSKKVDIPLKSTIAGGTIMADLVFTMGVGLIVDIIAGPLRTTKPQHIDVAYQLGKINKERSASELKKMTKKAAAN